MKGVNEKDCVLPLIFVQPCGNFSSILLIDMLNFVGLFVAVLFLSRSSGTFLRVGIKQIKLLGCYSSLIDPD